MNFATLDAFTAWLNAIATPVVLLEGTRGLSPENAPRLTDLAERLARMSPAARFRTGNAPGSDSAFAEGVARVDASRLEYVVPYPSHRSRYRAPGSRLVALAEVEDGQLADLLQLTREASPQYGSFRTEMLDGSANPKTRATARLLLRDTLKVTGNSTWAVPVAGFFYVNPARPTTGGTAHTMRVCQVRGIPVYTQAVWGRW
ncbi:MAG: hypothetical protein LCH53_08725 [Bacteroidetes bacterium]|nr:hypothetical protein [Bacteroidota bacterium]